MELNARHDAGRMPVLTADLILEIGPVISKTEPLV